MVPQTVWNLVRWTGAATLVLLASAVLDPARAEASCGDYVMIGGPHVGLHSASGGPASEAPAVPRCHGPLCSDNSVPPATPGPKIVLTVERWAIMAGARLTMLPNHETLLADTRDLPCDGYGLSILRPPR